MLVKAKPKAAGAIPPEHNIVSILYSLKGMIEAYLARNEKSRHNMTHEVLRKAYVQADRALKIVQRLRRLSLKAEQGFKPDRSGASVKKAWQAAIELLEKECSLGKVEFIDRIPDELSPIRCVSDDLEEILYHLAKNALEAMNYRGKLVIRTQLTFSVKEEPYALITLADTGAGISDRELACLFDPFYTTKEKSNGNGLGLYLTQQLVLKNSGQITASSFRGFGTTFILKFSM